MQEFLCVCLKYILNRDLIHEYFIEYVKGVMFDIKQGII